MIYSIVYKGASRSFWNASEIVVRSPKRVYTFGQIPELLMDMGLEDRIPGYKFIMVRESI